MNTCFFCGKLVCRRCYDPAHGACRSCGIKKGLIQEEDLTGEGAEEFGEEY
ncbi:MAG: hypothetical protein KAI64_04025 [Thermoplasmata archaeon]|nr:hypothetical protein [Thermoplasmata archaeon]